MKIVITGTTGFVGSNLQSFLETEGYTVVAINRAKHSGSYSFAETIPVDCNGSVWIHLAGKSKDVQKASLLDEYLEANVELTKKIFQAFINDPSATTFIYASSVKAAAAKVKGVLSEEDEFEVDVPYGVSKRAAEKFLQSVQLPASKKLIILRPVMIYGANSTGNLYSLYSFVKRGLPYPFAAFSNSRSFLSIENFMHVVLQILKRPDFKAGIYNVADDEVLSTNEIIELVGAAISKKPRLWKVSPNLIKTFALLGDKIHLPFNTKLIDKLTDNYVVSNKKLVSELGEPMPYQTRDSLVKLFKALQKK
jgi:nucleoside-diphosphate-sugar epimerase